MKVETRCLMDGWSKNKYRDEQSSNLAKKKRDRFFKPGMETDDENSGEGISDKSKKRKDAKGTVIDDFFLSDYPREDSEEF